MKATQKSYDPEQDFMRIRDFLVKTFALYQRPFNWAIDRWEFDRYFVLPVHTFYIRHFGVPITVRSLRDEQPGWEKTIRIWENEDGDIVGVVHSENEEPGEAWIQIHPHYTFLYDDMLTYIEAHLADRVDGTGYVKLYIDDEDCDLKEVAQTRGYRKLPFGSVELEYRIGDNIPAPQLPEGFVIRSVHDEDNMDKRRIVHALAFGARYSPSFWPPASTYAEMQKAPSYRKDLDLFIVAPNGDYASFCTIWIDEKNRYGNFEPVGTHPEYQRMGLGRALLTEGFRRMAQLGMTRSFMDSANEFYQKAGFKKTPYSTYPWIKYFPVE